MSPLKKGQAPRCGRRHAVENGLPLGASPFFNGLRSRLRTPGWRVLVAASVVVVLLATLGLLLAGTHRPAWYRPAAVDAARLREDKAALVSLEEEISAALNAGREVHLQLSEDELNRWLAARAEIWPEFTGGLGPFEQPQVLLRGGQIQIAATVRAGGLPVVAALTCSVAVTEDRVTIRCDAPRAGAIPAPRSWVFDLLARLPAGDRVAVDEPHGTIAVENDWTWPNGKRRCRLRELQIADRVADIVLEPLRTGRRSP